MQYCIIEYFFHVNHKIINKESETPYYKKKRKGENANMAKKIMIALFQGLSKYVIQMKIEDYFRTK